MMSSHMYISRFIQLCIIAILSIGIQDINGLSEFQVLQVVKGFADSYLSPKNIEVAKSINSTLFAEDVTGTADLSTNFDGRELSTLLFGLFVNTAQDPNDPSPFGSPISYNVTALLVQHHYVSTSIKFLFHYPVLSETYPIQIDAFMQVNDNGEIQQYDVSFRRWAWATDVIVPQLIPHMASNLNIKNTTDSSTILRQYLSSKVCKTATDFCTGSNQQYTDYDSCMSFLNERDIGEWYRMGEDNLVCRHLHVPMVSLRPSVHCAHIGPTGGDMCISRNYNQVVLDSHFPQGWLAPKFVTPENQDQIRGIQAVSGQDLNSALEISLSSGEGHSWDPTLYATALLGYFLLFYVCSNALWFVYFRKSSVFPTLGLEHQKNIVMYTMNIIFITIALALELVATPAFAGRYHLWEVQCLRTGGVLVSALYIFELIYRLKMRLPLIAHHFLTIIAISFTVTVFEYTQSMTYLISAVIWLFQATTEQPTFIGLLGYRLDWDPRAVSIILKVAAIQTSIFKSASAIGLMVYWGIHQNYAYRSMDKAWTAMVFIIAIGLLLTQIWGSWVTYCIGQKILHDPDLSQRKLKGSTLEVYQTIRLNSEHKKNNSSDTANDNDNVDDNDNHTEDDRYEVMTNKESHVTPTPLMRIPSLSLSVNSNSHNNQNLDPNSNSQSRNHRRSRLISRSSLLLDTCNLGDTSNEQPSTTSGGIPSALSPLLSSEDQHLFTAPATPARMDFPIATKPVVPRSEGQDTLRNSVISTDTTYLGKAL
ncbi:uncharacterized protein IL334_001089 [Kwoniella shivajii]|uniref:Uncharacterized protein n=1 Tax=Kwoniella shivajii TaxID=564305 RepID=A0ABZ1CSJ4_9TREE|nr:hypothetical protein IL334_001089 [Kwoniella shivajii]